jgi:protein SCO1/2
VNAEPDDASVTPDSDDAHDGASGSASGGILFALVAVVLVVAVAAGVYVFGKPQQRSALLPAGGEARLFEHRVLDQTDTELSTHDLLDRFLVVDFVFTGCGATCPELSSAMQTLQARLRGVDDVRIVSFTVDPERDSPAVLARYAHELDADPALWSFLFTNVATVHRIAFEGMKVGHPTEVIAHSNDFVLIDRSGAVRGYYHPLKDVDWLDVLLADIDRLRDEPGAVR